MTADSAVMPLLDPGYNARDDQQQDRDPADTGGETAPSGLPARWM
jgi:hypothetical protein